jgi:hypothetical protein
VFFRSGSGDSPSFQAYANTLATELGATKFDDLFNADPKKQYPVGPMGCARESNVFEHARLWSKALGRKVDQLHVIGHIPSEGPNCMPAGGPTKEQKDAFVPDVKIVVHGCVGCGRYKGGWKGILKHLPEAKLYAHTQSAEAGGPLNFARIELDEQGQLKQSPVSSIIDEGVGFTRENVKQWARAHLRNLKATGPGDAGWGTIEFWLTDPEFRSKENAILAEAILCDPKPGLIDPDVRQAAEDFLRDFDPGSWVYLECDEWQTAQP